jgi:hypothetical protein
VVGWRGTLVCVGFMHWWALCEYIPHTVHMRSGQHFCVWFVDRHAKHLTGQMVTGLVRRTVLGLAP